MTNKHQARTVDSISSPNENLITYSDRSEAFKILATLTRDAISVDDAIISADKIATYLADGTLPEKETPEDEQVDVQ